MGKKKRKGPKSWVILGIVLAAGAASLPVVWQEEGYVPPVETTVPQTQNVIQEDLSEVEMMVKAYAEERGISFDAYPESLVALLERNPETADFVLNYPFRTEQTIDLSGYDRSAGVPLMMQWDTRWGYIQYGSDVVGLTGCGPLSLAMAGYYVTGDEKFSPDAVVAFSLENGYSSYGNGTAWTLISEGGVRLGLDVTEIPLSKQRIMANLQVGNPIICAMGPGDFTTTGHFIVLAGTEDGKIRVNDPNSYVNSEKLWTYEEMESQFRNLWVIRAGTAG